MSETGYCRETEVGSKKIQLRLKTGIGNCLPGQVVKALQSTLGGPSLF